MADVRTYAFYLPQFHRTAENDAWWGQGFTEWTNVTKALPRFPGHQQPRLPTDLGFYDLRVASARREQGRLARDHGIQGFIYYHYWFNGRRLLHEPFDDMIADPSDDMPFALCWANEDWRANWDGRSGEVLVHQEYDEQDDVEHARFLVRALSDPRCIRVDGLPLFLVYRPALLPDVRATTERWRRVWREAGIGEVHLCLVESMERLPGAPGDHGFDAAVEFAPDWESTGPSTTIGGVDVRDYRELADRMLTKPEPSYLRHSGVTPGFDNTPRRPGAGLLFRGSTPEAYRQWLSATVTRDTARADRAGRETALVFVNAWNEWAEGAVLEPCSHVGRGYLEAHRAGSAGSSGAALELPSVAIATVADSDVEGCAQRLTRLGAVESLAGRRVQLILLDPRDQAAWDVPPVPGVDLVRAGGTTDPGRLWERALGASRTDVTVLVGPDIEVQGDWLAQVLPQFEDGACDCVVLDVSPPGADGARLSAAADQLSGVAMALRMESLRSGRLEGTRIAPSTAFVEDAGRGTRTGSRAPRLSPV